MNSVHSHRQYKLLPIGLSHKVPALVAALMASPSGSKVAVAAAFQVLWCQDSLAIMTGINPDAPIGTKLAFVSGGSGILLWHRSDNLAFAIIAGGASSIKPGDSVECKIRGILQVLDETRGPITRKEYELMQAPAGDSLYGAVVNYIGQPITEVDTPANSAAVQKHKSKTAAVAALNAQQQGEEQQQQLKRPGVMTSWEEDDGPDIAGHGIDALGLERLKPLINQQVAMKNRDQITESLFTGVKALDTLTPLGRGASLLVIGPNGSGKTTLALDAIQGCQKGARIRCVLSSTTQTAEQLDRRLKVLEAAGCLDNTAVFFAPPDATLGTRLATVMAAAAAGERIRDEGGHSLVVLDDLAPLSDAWDKLVLALADLGQEKLREGLIKDEAGNDVALSPQTEQELVDYEGMLVSGAVAQRRGFFSILFLRAAKLHSSFGGGSMSLLPLVPGRPASGTKAQIDMSKYQTLSEEQKEKLSAMLEKKKAAEAAVMALSVGPGEVKTETVEEFISIADGQVVLEPSMNAPSTSSEAAVGPVPFSVNPKLSITRVGSRAYYKALEHLAPQIRLDLAQAEDARKFATNQDDPVLRRYEAYSQRIAAALQQQPGEPVPLEELVVILFAIQSGLADTVQPRDVSAFLAEGLDLLRRDNAKVLTDIAKSKQLTAASEKGITETFKSLLQQRGSQ
eukprot:GHUV01011155.1.p1 GENE.GHUV01011155.1~~GHUV01011155.1.p1  ORF type:complete len:682 (+),score=208.59 GHUV01011155.1:600-2645(+)